MSYIKIPLGLRQISKYISIDEDSEELRRQSVCYDAVRKLIFDKLCDDPFLKTLIRGTDLFESNSENALRRVEHQDVYSCYVLLDFSKLGPKLKVSEVVTGSYTIDIRDWLIQNTNARQPFYQDLRNLTDEYNGRLLPHMIIYLLEDVMVKQGLTNKYKAYENGMTSFYLRYEPLMGQVFEVQMSNGNKFYVDLVLSIKVDSYAVKPQYTYKTSINTEQK